MKNICFIIALLATIFTHTLYAQSSATFTHDDTLRGSVTPERIWWDLTFYDLKVKVDIQNQSISGSNTIHYKVLTPNQTLQIDLQGPLSIERVLQNDKPLSVHKMGQNAYFVDLLEEQKAGSSHDLTVFYKGTPVAAKRAPWDGGFSWETDKNGHPFVATSCQGLGASVWWPCKDHMYDEPDSMQISITVPKDLMDVSNGRLRQTVENNDGTKTFVWGVKNPINNYGVNVNIGNYVHFSEDYQGEKGILTTDFYVLPENLVKAKVQFKQVAQMLKAFEHWFGPYPFYEDGFKLVEVPYLGMEHQSSVTYGNKYANGYLGRDLSGTGWGLKWDFIIIHESGHEWFANNVTYRDAADMWIHEGFTAYSEALFTEYYYGKQAGTAYVMGIRKNIMNDRPIIGKYDVNSEGSGDMYYKGSNMLHTMRQIVDNDEKWRQILRGINKDFYHKTVTTAEIENYMSQKSGKNLQKVFDQYLRTPKIPVFDYKLEKGKLSYRWTNCVEGFDMPIKIMLEPDVYTFVYPKTTWQTVKTKWKTLDKNIVDANFYVIENKEN